MDRFEAIRIKCDELFVKARELYGVEFGDVKVGFNLTGRVAGWAGCKTCRQTGKRFYDMRFNRDLISGKHFEDILNETCAHEVAHLCCYARPELGRRHDSGWKRVCIALGGNGRERHNYEVIQRNGYDYLTDRGVKVTVSAVRHSRIQKGSSYQVGKGGVQGRIDRYSRWCRVGQTMPATPPNERVVATFAMPTLPRIPASVSRPQVMAQSQAVPVARKGTYREQVQSLVRMARSLGRDQASVIRSAEMLGMKPSSARNCVRALWNVA
jgi:predicted SprT family Zn-dependent metalloprotease